MRKILKPFTLICTALILGACSIDNIGAPSWVNEFIIALPGETYTMSKLAEEDSLFSIGDFDGTTGVMWINIVDSSDKEFIDQADLSTKPESDHFSMEAGSIILSDELPQFTENINLETLLGQAFDPGDILPADPVSREFIIADQKIQFDEYQSATVEKADIIINVFNGLFIDFDKIDVDVYDDDPDGRVLIKTLTIDGPIPGGGTASNESNPAVLENVDISNKFSLDYTVTTSPRAANHTLTSEDLNASLTLSIELKLISARNVVAMVPAQVFSQVDSANVVQDDVQMTYASIEKGAVTLSFVNHLPVSGLASVTFTDLFKDGDTLVVERQLVADDGMIQVLLVDLAGVEIMNGDNPGGVIEYFRYRTEITSDASVGFVTFNFDDSVAADIVLDSLYFSKIGGIFVDKDLEIDPVVKNDIVDYGNVPQGFRFNQMRLIFTFNNEIGLPIDADFQITGKHKDKDTGMFTHSVTLNVNNVNIAPDAVSELILDGNDTNPNIVDFMEILPTDIFINATATTGGAGEIASGKGFYAVFDLNSPLALVIPSPLDIIGDANAVTEEDIDPGQQEDIRKHVQSASAHYSITSRLPVGATAKLYVSKNEGDLFSDVISDSSKKFIIDSLIVPASAVDIDGYTTESLINTFDIVLSQQNIHLLSDVPYYTGYKVTLDATGQEVILKADDFVSPRGKFKIKILIDNTEE